MKVYSLYYKDTFVVAFPDRGSATDYGKIHYADLAWDCNILEEYLNKTPYQMYTPPYTSLTPQQTIPCKPILDTGIMLTDGPVYTNPYNYGVRAKDYPVELVGEPGPEPHS
jgi:hypothetical protein